MPGRSTEVRTVVGTSRPGRWAGEALRHCYVASHWSYQACLAPSWGEEGEAPAYLPAAPCRACSILWTRGRSDMIASCSPTAVRGLSVLVSGGGSCHKRGATLEVLAPLTSTMRCPVLTLCSLRPDHQSVPRTQAALSASVPETFRNPPSPLPPPALQSPPASSASASNAAPPDPVSLAVSSRCPPPLLASPPGLLLTRCHPPEVVSRQCASASGAAVPKRAEASDVRRSYSTRPVAVVT